LSKDVPENDDWAAVGQAVSKRMLRLGISIAYLARESGLSETTIRYIGDPARRNTKSTLVALSAVLGWRYDYLTNILHQETQDGAQFTSPVETYLENLLRAEVGPVKQEVTGIKDIIHIMDQKIDVIIQAQHPVTDTAEQP
jgi:plasmid maintenance system antidote protein VapI